MIQGVLNKNSTQLRYWAASYFPVPLHNGERGVAAAITEITELKRAEQALEESQRFINRISESTPGIIYIYSLLQRQVVYLNTTVTTLLGYTVDEVMQMEDAPRQLVHTDDFEKLRTYTNHLIIAADTTETVELRLRKKEGSWRWLEIRSVVFSRTETGAVEQILGICTDVSLRKRSEQKLRKQKKALEDAISMAQAADSANQAKSEFLANMSHEIRTPMSLILGTSELLSNTALNPRQQELLKVLRKNGGVLLTLINDILDLSKLEAKELKIERHPLNLRHSLNILVEPFKHQAEQKHLDFSVEVAPIIPQTLISDEFRIQQILRNLLSNAFKFTETGEIKISVEAVPALETAIARPSLEHPHDAAVLLFRVTDTGIGIAPEIQSGLFEPFIQADTSTTRQYGGTGLGLTICRRIVELMQGEIGVDSQTGVGSSFWFKIPCQYPETALARGDTISVDLPVSCTAAEMIQTPILIVEDNADNQALLMLMLDELCCSKVDVVENGQAFLDKMATGPEYSLVFMDCQMPYLDGYEATRRFRQQEPPDQHVQIIGLTANAMRGDREKCLAAGMDDYLSKPVSLEDLARVLQQRQ